MIRDVHICARDDSLLYDRLLDDGGALLRFASGFGFVTRDNVTRSGWIVRDGWTASEPDEDSDEDDGRICPTCDGAGSYHPDFRTVCQTCKGDGYLPEED